MAAAPAYASTPWLGIAAISTANTARDGTGTVADFSQAGTIVAPTNGRLINRLVLKATGDPADSVVTIFIHNATSYFLFDEFDLNDPAAASTTAEGIRMERAYRDLVLPSGWKMAGAITVALTSGVINGFLHGAELT